MNYTEKLRAISNNLIVKAFNGDLSVKQFERAARRLALFADIDETSAEQVDALTDLLRSFYEYKNKWGFYDGGGKLQQGARRYYREAAHIIDEWEAMDE